MNLVVFLMRNMSLRLYDEIGMFEREMALYRKMQARGARVSVVTWGGVSDLRYRRRLPGIRILCNWLRLPREIYERRVMWLHAAALWRADVIKADQMGGAEVAAWASHRWRKPLVVRNGFSHTATEERKFGAGSPQVLNAQRLARFVYERAEQVVVTTEVMAREARDGYGVPSDRITVVPNYVDTERFRPDPAAMPDARRVCTVGRLAREKNQAALIRATAWCGANLDIVGAGPEEAQLRATAAEVGASVNFHGSQPNRNLPAILRRAAIFVLPSLYEGHPKTLLEAMACGVACLGADVTGIRELVRHGENGWLCGTSADSIRQGLETLLGDAALRLRLGRDACRLVEERFALDRIVEQELNVYRRMLGKPLA
jgi:glycosyltransferase involved in cell wall biosynthesis